MIERIKYYFYEELWNFSLDKEKGARHFWLKWLRIAFLAGRGFVQDRCTLSASSLTYYTMISIVPVLAMAVAIARGFGYHEKFRAEIFNHFQEQNEAVVVLFEYADSFLEQAKGGVIAGFGLVILFVTITLLLSNLEGILNHIWGVKRLRSWQRVLSDYFALMLISPVIFILASSTSVFIVDILKAGIRELPLSGASLFLFLVNLIPYCLFWILFSFLYLFMPNTKVKVRSALIGGLFSSILYLIVQWGYIYFQVGATRYGVIYGSMAALPLFLVWVQVSWFLLLFGAEICYAHQTLEEHEFEDLSKRASHSFKRIVSLWIVHLAVIRFEKGQLPLSREMIIKKYQVPVALARPILQELIDSHLLLEVKEGYVPARPSDELRISDCLFALEEKGECKFPFIDSKTLAPFEKALKQFQSQIESSPHNLKLSDVPNTI